MYSMKNFLHRLYRALLFKAHIVLHGVGCAITYLIVGLCPARSFHFFAISFNAATDSLYTYWAFLCQNSFGMDSQKWNCFVNSYAIFYFDRYLYIALHSCFSPVLSAVCSLLAIRNTTLSNLSRLVSWVRQVRAASTGPDGCRAGNGQHPTLTPLTARRIACWYFLWVT